MVEAKAVTAVETQLGNINEERENERKIFAAIKIGFGDMRGERDNEKKARVS